MPDINGAIQNATIDTAMGAAVGESAGDIATDIVLDELIDALVEEYAKASIEMQGKCDNYLSKYAKEDAEKRSLLDAKKISKEDYQAWQKSKILGGKQWIDMRDTLAQDLTHCNEIAADIINDRKCDVYALNRNYGTYEIEQGVGACTSYTLYDHDTVERLISQNPELLPKTKIDIPKDLQWNKQQLTSAVTQGILQGESIPSIAKRMAAVTDMDKNSAIRNARTATTGAENAGRVESYKRAEKMGIKVTQIWISTLDGRTRTSHRHMMGEKRVLGKAFSNKCRFPGDPQGPGWEVYNCRCTLIAEPDGSGYDLEKTIDKNLSKKGMTFDEWVNQQPLPRHYGESKQHYLERYAKHKKQLSFGEWLGEQAAPDSAIQSVWGDKKMSQMYNEIKAQSVTDANKFYKELGKLGKPSEVWEKYLTGQLDAEDMKNFEDILKKYLPAPSTNATAPIFTAKYEGKISKEAQDSLDKLKFKAGNPMDKDAADSYKVNPLYDKADKATTKNCQTSAFAYECRRQGYDVVALPKYGLNIDDPELKEILQLQNTLGKDARLGWINKETGAPATLVIEHSNPMLIMSNSEMIDELENAIGKSGERYIMGVRWKGTTSCHAINIDRTPDGKLRIIDNQRGPLEKNTWVGKEIEDYLDSVQRIKHVTRVDDCVPNAEYFNKIVVDAKKVKADLPSNVSAFDQYSKLAKQAKDAGEKTSTYYVKWKAGLIDNKDLDDLLTHGAVPKVDLDTYKANLLKDPSLENKLDDIAIKAANDNQLFTNDYLMAYLKGEKQNDYLDNMLKKKLPSPDPTLTKVDDVAKHNDDILKYYKDKSLYDADVPMEVTGISANKYFKAGLNSASDYWNKYKLGEIKDVEIDKILGIKSVSTSTPVSASVSAKADFIKKWENTSFKNLPDDAYAKVMFGSSNKGIPASEYWEKYLAGEIKNSKLDEILSLPDSIQNVEFIHPATGEVLNKFDELEKIKNMPVTNLDDMAQTLVKDYYDLKLDDAKQILKDLGLNIPEKKATNTTFDLAKKELEGNTWGGVQDLLMKHDDVDDDLLDELSNVLSKIKKDNSFVTKGQVFDEYFAGNIKSKELDDVFEKIYGKPATTTSATSIGIFDKSKLPQSMGAMNDEMFNEVAEILNNKGVDDNTSHYKKWLKGKVDDEDLDKYFGISTPTPTPAAASTIATKATTAVDIDAVKNKKVTAIYNEIKTDLGTSEANAFYNKTLKQIGAKNNLSQGEVWKKYLGGELDADDIKKIDDHLIKKYSKTVEPPKPTFDKSAFDNKKMSQVYNDIKATDTATANKFYNDLKKMGKPSEVWDEYLKGNLPQDKADIIEAHLKKKYTTAPPAQGAKAGTAAMDAEAQKKLDEAKKKLDEATQELETIKKELPENKTYSGIWKDDVTLDDYLAKKDKIGAKKQYYYDEIEALEHCIDDPDSWQFKKYGGESGLNKKIAEYEKYIDDLDKFEKEGQEYLAKKAEVDKKIKSAEKKVADAKKNVSDLTPVGEAYTQERKDSAKWFTSKSYKDGDKYYSALPATKDAHKSATSAEHKAYVEYTSASGGFNRPLAGFKAPQYSGGSGWDEKYYKGVGNVPLDNENKGKDIKNLTTFVEKSKMEDDIWVQTAQNYATLEGKNGFLGVPYGSLSGMTDSQLQQFVGVENQLGQFISASINRGGGSYTPGNMRINIYCPKGSEALYVLSDGTFGKAEHEIILQRGGTYKVSKIYWGTDAEHGGKKLMVDLELRLEKGYNKYEK